MSGACEALSPVCRPACHQAAQCRRVSNRHCAECRYYVGHKGKFGHEFLEFEFRPDGKVRLGWGGGKYPPALTNASHRPCALVANVDVACTKFLYIVLSAVVELEHVQCIVKCRSESHRSASTPGYALHRAAALVYRAFGVRFSPRETRSILLVCSCAMPTTATTRTTH